MKRINFLIVIFSLIAFTSLGQTVEEDVVGSYHSTTNTTTIYDGYWTKFATCEVVAPYQDYSTIFELLGNGGSNTTFFYGKLIARIKRQNSAPGIPTHYSLILYDSNIGSENIKGIINGSTVDFYIKINRSYTRYTYRRILKGYGNSLITSISNQPFISALPSGDIVIECKEGEVNADQLAVKGNVGIGVTNPSEKLEVDGTILAEEVKVQNVPQSDYVFDPDYNLLPLTEVETFIKENKHLPEIPSAEEFKENGVGLGEMDDMLLRKVEELTLYVIEQNKNNVELFKKIEELEEENDELREKVDNQEQEIKKLKNEK